ncbi:MAG: hypothetical protein QG599_1550 [Pseudomonadota bacterium]|nr:hypothetical protein [Pseudomonadota bacterium]
MQIEDILDELGHQTGLGALSLNEDRVCRLVFDDRLTVDIEALPDKQRFFIHAVVGPAPSSQKEAIFAEMLSANLFGQDTGGACLALDRNREEVLLFKEFLTDQMDYPMFSAALEVFLNRLDHWKNWLLSGNPDGLSTTDAFPPSSLFIRP